MLVAPHGPEQRLLPLLVPAEELAEERQRAASLPAVAMTSRETSDLIMTFPAPNALIRHD